MADLRIVDSPLIPKVDITGSEKIPTGGSGNYSISLDGIAEYTQESLDLADKADVLNSENGVKALLKQHTDNLSNPHVVTKEQIGLGNVDNTADADKQMSNLVQSAITTLDQKKVDKTSVYLKTETYNKNEVDSALANKPNSNTVYTKIETNNLLSGKVARVNGKYGTVITLTRSDLGISSDEVMRQWLKEARFVEDESGLNQQQINNKLITTVESIADLIAIPNPKNGQVVFVKSYYAGLNKGYGDFYYNGTDWIRISNKESLEGYGLRGDGVANDKGAIALGQVAKVPLTIESSEVYTPVFLADFNCNIEGNNTTVYVNSTIESVPVQVRDGSRLSNIKFDNSRAGSKAWSYSGIRNNVYLKNVGFYGFRDNVPMPNSWGVLLESVKDITFDNCHFGSNSQADIALTDNVENITIINAKNGVDGGVSLNFEPNDIQYCKNIQVIGGTYRIVQILENNYLSTSNKGLVFLGSIIKDLIYDGGDVVFTNTIINNIRNEVVGDTSYAGSMLSDSINVGENLVPDPYFFNLGNASDPIKYWSVFDPVGGGYVNKYDSKNGRYLQLNQSDSNREVGMSSQFIDVPLKFLLATSMAGTGLNLSSNNIDIYFYNSAQSQIGAPLKVINVRGNPTEKLGWKNSVLFVDAPVGTKYIKLYVKNQPTASVNIRSIGIYNYDLLSSYSGNMTSTLNYEIFKVLGRNLTVKLSTMFFNGTSYGRPNYFVGDKVVIDNYLPNGIREYSYTGVEWVATLKNAAD